MEHRETSVPEAFGLLARARSAEVAVVDNAGVFSYGVVNERANQLAHLLRDNGVGPESVVGLALPSGADLVTAVLAVLKAGAAYLCLPVSGPSGRLDHMVRAGGVDLIVTATEPTSHQRDLGVRSLRADTSELGGQPASDIESGATPDSLAYLVFTSGTTGGPKPVAVSHRSLINHVRRISDLYRLGRRDRVLQFASPGFDVFAEEVFPTLLAGARLVVPPDSVLPPSELEHFLAHHHITLVNLPASFWAHWAHDIATRRASTGSLRLVVIGSEAAPASALNAWRRHSDVPVINAYGLSETTITVATKEFSGDERSETDVLPVGRPIPGAETHILDATLRLVSPGQRGELFIGGVVLARGYHRLPAVTATRFVPDPFSNSPGARLYRTGDLARYGPDGSIQILGRSDDQVKIRGHRIEPAEVAAALTSHPAVAQAHVLANTDDTRSETYLVAYVVPSDRRRVAQAGELATYMRDSLPAPMVPRAFVVVDALPVTDNGKVDGAALPPVNRRERPAETPYVAPRTATQRLVAEVWRDAVGIDRVGLYDDPFELGGHSLTALRVITRLRSTFDVDLAIRELFHHRTVAELAEWLDAAQHDPVRSLRPPVPEPDDGSRIPLSLQQEQVWFLHRFAPDSIAYHAQTTIRVVGAIDLDRLDRAITEIDRRHEILRTTYTESDGKPWQVVHPPQPIQARRVDISHTADGQHELLDEILGQELRKPFHIERLPLIRWTAVRLSEEEHELILVENHLLHDGWSFALLMRELKTLYNAFTEGVDSPLADLPIQYRDFARWQRTALETAPMQAQLTYWRNQLGDLPPLLELPVDRPRPAIQSFRGETLRVDLPPGLPDALRSFCRAHRVTLFSTMLAAFYTVLHRYTGQRDIMVGSAFASRQVPRTEDLIGMFVNTVLLRCDVHGTLTFEKLVENVHGVVLDATANELLPFPELVRVLNPSREPGRNPLTEVLFSVNDSPIPNLDLAGATGTIFEHGNGSAKMDLDVVVIPRAESQGADAEHTDGRITMLWEYVVDLFDGATIRRMADSYIRLLTDAIARPTAPLFELALLGRREREKVLVDWNPERHHRPDGPLVHHAVRAQARDTPDAPAIRESTREVSYADLVRRADSLAGILRARGVGPRSVVGVCLPRGADLVIAELAVLYAAAAYLPLDPENPPARLADQYTAAGAVLIITTSVAASQIPGDFEQLPMDRLPDATGEVEEDPPDPTTHNDLAYLIATSGSTGQPKTVMVDHRSLSNVVGWRCRWCDLGTADRIAQVASPGFDTSVMDIWPTLVSGATLYVPDQDIRLNPERLRSWLVDEGITVTELPTALAERVLALPWPTQPALRELITGGDRLRIRPAATIPFRVLNEYGPTETAATATAGYIEPVGTVDGPPDIGRPITGVSAYILDAWRQPVPSGATGELWVGGIGVARGYHGSPGMTADRFVPDPFSDVLGRRMYRTGDRARHLPNGQIAFLGRRDRQVKLRGYRIEPAEVVEALRAHPAVTDAVVLMTTAEDGDREKRLVAYLVADNQASLLQQVREHLADRLPRYMIPSDFVRLDSLPLNRNGKVDERALPTPGPAVPDPGHRVPSSDAERMLADIWCRVLRLDRVGLDDNFFDIGGHSLLLAAVQQGLAERGHDLSIVTFFEYTTIQRLARYVDDRDTVGDEEADESGRLAGRGAGRTRLGRRRAAVRSAELTNAIDDGRAST
jgi:amino acid adenylation domain-containing protein